VSTLEVHSSAGSDTFAVTPSPQTTYELDGAAPTSAPGDALTYEAGGRVVPGVALPPAGTLSASGVAPVRYAGFERVTVAGATPADGAPKCSLDVASNVITRKHARLTLLAPCSMNARIKLTGSVKITCHAHKATRQAIKASSATLTAGTIKSLNLKLPAAALSSLRRGAKETVSLTLIATSASGTARATKTIKLARS
jgi:hypothetical protein